MAFEAFECEWGGKKYTIAPHRILRAIALVEDVVTLAQLQEHGERGSLPMAKIAMAFGVLLRYAGASVTDVEVYEGLFSSIKDKNAQGIVDAVVILMSLMVPPSVQSKVVKDNPPGNVLPAANKRASFKARTK